MPCLTQDEKDCITVALLEVADRFGGNAPIGMLLIHRQAAEVCGIIEARDRAQIALPVQLVTITAFSDLADHMWGPKA
ncbi:hypothetical protein [Paracoccus sp. ME4]|uniref:hypothetical protein n=1 Tax=Paracoccus sp. ME4 TaxID=3138066 RepID=UPI00398B9B88